MRVSWGAVAGFLLLRAAVAWAGADDCGTATRLPGIDLSSYQGAVDWEYRVQTFQGTFLPRSKRRDCWFCLLVSVPLAPLRAGQDQDQSRPMTG
jgi:hypothetical protein